MRRSGNWKVTFLRGVADPVGKPQTRPINNLFRRKEAIKGMYLKTFRHMFSNKLENDIKCCINVWWRRERKTLLSKGLGWNWNIILSRVFSYSDALGKPGLTVCKMRSVRSSPFFHSNLLPEFKTIKCKQHAETTGTQSVFNIILYELDHGLEI